MHLCINLIYINISTKVKSQPVFFWHVRPLKYVKRLLLQECSYNASSVRSGVIGHKDRPVSQWMIIKMGYNVCITHVVAVCNSTRKAPRQLQRRHRTLLYPSRCRHEMQDFDASRIERGHPRDV